MFIKKKNKLRPMRIETSVATPTINPFTNLISTVYKAAEIAKKTVTEAVKPASTGSKR